MFKKLIELYYRVTEKKQKVCCICLWNI